MELTSCLHAADYSAPSLRYIIYGRPGCGKSTTLAYVMHYCGRAGWYVVHEPWLPHPLHYASGVEPSSFTPGLCDYFQTSEKIGCDETPHRPHQPHWHQITHRRLKRPLTLTLILRQRPIICRHARSGRFRRRCGDLMPVRSVRPVQCFVTPEQIHTNTW